MGRGSAIITKLMSKQQRKNMDELYNKLKGDKQSVQNQTIRRHDA